MEFKYDKIGVDYNSTRHADPFITSRLIHHLRPSTEDKYLDIGCGTGNYTIALSKPGYTFIGMDPSKIMLSEAKARNSDVDWRFGSAEDTGMTDLSIDGIIASLTIHHWTNLHKPFLSFIAF